jgi:hypothetical protein
MYVIDKVAKLRRSRSSRSSQPKIKGNDGEKTPVPGSPKPLPTHNSSLLSVPSTSRFIATMEPPGLTMDLTEDASKEAHLGVLSVLVDSTIAPFTIHTRPVPAVSETKRPAVEHDLWTMAFLRADFTRKKASYYSKHSMIRRTTGRLSVSSRKSQISHKCNAT